MTYLKHFKTLTEMSSYKNSDNVVYPYVLLADEGKKLAYASVPEVSKFPLYLYPIGDANYNEDDYIFFQEYAYELLGGHHGSEDGAASSATIPTDTPVYYNNYLVTDIEWCPNTSSYPIFWENSSGENVRRYCDSGSVCNCPF